MIRFLVQRPIAVFMSFLAALIFSTLAYFQLPVSLLPDIEVPQIIIKTNYKGASPATIEQNILRPVRQTMLTMKGLRDLRSTANSESGQLDLYFDYGTAMDLAYIEANEKLDRLIDQLPPDLDRPRIVRINTSDIPVVRLQVIPRNPEDYLQVSELADKVLRKRLEQLEGVSLVDLNGHQSNIIAIRPDLNQLDAYGISLEEVFTAIRSSNSQLGSIQVRDGHYTYFMKIGNKVESAEDLAQISIRSPGGAVIKLGQVASIINRPEQASGYHLVSTTATDAKEGLVLTIHKQAEARMNELMPLVKNAVTLLEQDFPQVEFLLTQDQSELLSAGIDNLVSSLFFGGLFAFGVLFVFLGNFRTALVIGLSIPVSLIISFSIFWLFGISVNIISLSGLALGLGMLIDNSIIVLDNIYQKRKTEPSLFEACVAGVGEVMAPLISSVLTTLAVFIPLIYLNGISGALFFDQAVAVAAILSMSLIVAFILLPLLYHLFHKNSNEVKEDSFLFGKLLNGYKYLYHIIWRRKLISFILLISLIPTGWFISIHLKKDGLPEVKKSESLLTITWNEPVDAKENKQRVVALLDQLNQYYQVAEGDVGLNQFLLQNKAQNIDEAKIYLQFENFKLKNGARAFLQKTLETNYPNASWSMSNPPNAFDQLFTNDIPKLQIRLSDLKLNKPIPSPKLSEWLSTMPQEIRKALVPAEGMAVQTAVYLNLNYDKLQFYKINPGVVYAKMQQLFNHNYQIEEIKSFGIVTPIILTSSNDDFQTTLAKASVNNELGERYPLSQFINIELTEDYKAIHSGKTGIYQAYNINGDVDVKELERAINKSSRHVGINSSLTGQFFTDQENLYQLILILSISVMLLYFILAAQFESFVQPLIIIFTMPVGIAGSLFLLWITGHSLNIMSMIGIIVVLGIMVNDSILKIDTINRLRGNSFGDEKNKILKDALDLAGQYRLKPILMTSITTILALLPVLFYDSIGSQLQSPLVISVIGGLTIGTFAAIYFVPLGYWFLHREKK